MTPAARVAAAIEIIATISADRSPASEALKDWGKAHRFAGSGDRAGIASLVESGHCGVLWTSHNMVEVEAVCDRVLFLSRGSIVLEGDPKRLPGEHGVDTLDDLFVTVAQERLATGDAS